MRGYSVLKVLVVAVILILVVGCTKQVPIGYIGAILEPSGLQKKLLAPGRHQCFGRALLVLVDVGEHTKTIKMQILCADELNFGFDLNIRFYIAIKDNSEMQDVLNKKGSSIVAGGGIFLLDNTIFYKTYVLKTAESISRGIVSQYQTTQVRENRKKIEAQLNLELKDALKGTPVKITLATTSNFDYPKVITDAMVKKRKREIQIGEEKAKQEVALLEMENRLKLAQKALAVRATEAKAEAIYNKVLGASLTDKYLRLREIESKMSLYQKIGPGDKVIVDSDSKPFVGTK